VGFATSAGSSTTATIVLSSATTSTGSTASDVPPPAPSKDDCLSYEERVFRREMTEHRRWLRDQIQELPAPGSRLDRAEEWRTQTQTIRRWRRVALGKRPGRRASG
jgi:hypothetical protein